MRKVIAYFIKYDVAINIIIITLFVFGVIGALLLKSSFFPLIEAKLITIEVSYPGASPKEIEEGVILKIEDNLEGLEGVDEVFSTSKEDIGTVFVEIRKGKNIDLMLLEINNAIARIRSFPIGMEPLIVSKSEDIRQTISFALSGESVPLTALKTISREIENDLRDIDGISQVNVTGYPEEEVEIALREDDLRAYNLTFDQVADAIANANILVTGGKIKTNAEELLIRADNKKYYSNELSNLIVRADTLGRTIRLKDIAVLRDRFLETSETFYFNDNIAVHIVITSNNTEDLISSANKAKAYSEKFNRKHQNLQLDVINDLSITLNQRTALLIENAVMGIVLVLVFLSIFLNVRLAFWVAFGLPIAFLGMFIFVGQFDITINVISLLGMIIVIGILVDDGIVIAENIYHHYEQGKSPTQAAIDGTMEVIPAVVSAIITTLLAFSTFLFLEGHVGELFREVSVIVILTLSISLIEALLILPAHLANSKALQPPDKHPKKGITLLFSKMGTMNTFGDRCMNWLKDVVYSPILRFTIAHKIMMFSIFIALFILTIGAIGGGTIGMTFFPKKASDRIIVDLNMPNGTPSKRIDSILSFIEGQAKLLNQELTQKYIKDKSLHKNQVFKNYIKDIRSASNATLTIYMLPGEERSHILNATMVANLLSKKVGVIYGVERLVFGSGGNLGGDPVLISLRGNTLSELKAAKEEVKKVLQKNSKLKDVADNDPEGIKEIRLKLKEKAYLLGLDLQSVMRQVRAGFFGIEAQRFQRGQDEISVWVRYDKNNRSSIQNLAVMRIVTPKGERIPLAEIATYSIEGGDLMINHFGGKREIQITADLRDPNGSATDIMMNFFSEVMPRIESKYPTVTTSFEGQHREIGKIMRSIKFVFPLVFFLIYVTIAFTFRSYSQPLLLLLLIPFSITAVAWGHFIHGIPMSMLSYLGIIALIGVLVNDGLVFISKFNRHLREGLPFDEALYETGRARFRAIFLTSLTTIVGLAPLIFEKSRQAQFLKPMAIALAYGIGYVTILTLILLPLFLSFSNYVKMGIQWLATGRCVTKEEVERVIKEQKKVSQHE